MNIRFYKSIFWFAILAIIGAGNVALNNRDAKPERGKLWSLPLSGGTVLSMVWVPSGKFIMGSPESELDRKADESPLTDVTIAQGFWLGKTEVTIGQWKAVMNEGLKEHVIKMLKDETVYDFGSQKQKLREFMHFDPNDPDKIMANEDDALPMYFVSWYEAMEFCKKLSERERAMKRLPKGYEYTLPTEAQWEYACRAGTTAATYAEPLDSIGWYNGNSPIGYKGKKLGNTAAGPRRSGEKLPNAWGLIDMPGNIWEWCRDWYGSYKGGSFTDPEGPEASAHKVNRGGSWGSGMNSERSATRASNPPAEKSAYRGFRLTLCVKL